MKKETLLFLAVLTFVCLNPYTLQAAEAQASEGCGAGICFPAEKIIGARALPLKGSGLLEFMKFDMYSAALYAPSETQSIDSVLGNTPRSLVLNYHRNIKTSWMLKAAEHMLRKNPAVDFEKIKERVDQISKAYKKVEKNDQYELQYIPDSGTTLFLNGEPQVTIPGEDFARAYFGIWLSDYPANSRLRDELLGFSQKD